MDGDCGDVEARLSASSDGIDMTRPPVVLSSTTVYRGAVFRVDDREIGLPRRDGGQVTIRRQVMCHRPCVVMLVHDQSADRYLLEREYRAGSGIFAFGLPAGLIEQGEAASTAALRELREEAGVVADGPGDAVVEPIAETYSSEGMADELAHIVRIDLAAWHQSARDFDPSEHVQSAWVTWTQLSAVHISESNGLIAILHERLRRLDAAPTR